MRRELFKLPEADDAELFCKEASEFALPAVQEDRNTAVINVVAVIENKKPILSHIDSFLIFA